MAHEKKEKHSWRVGQNSRGVKSRVCACVFTEYKIEGFTHVIQEHVCFKPHFTAQPCDLLFIGAEFEQW